MSYTVKQLSEIAGVSVRTLHYYDEVGLLKPSSVRENGYRVYEQKELMKLQQILFFKELEFPLETIRTIMETPSFDALAALLDQKKLLEKKKQRIEKLLETITTTIRLQKGGELMNTDDTFSAFNDPTYQQYKDEVEKKWGNTKAYKQSMQRVGKMSKEEFTRVKAEGGAITQAIADLKIRGFSSDSVEVQQQIDRFYKHLHHYYDPSFDMFKGLGKMYVQDARFSKTYEDIASGLAIFMHDAMTYYADQHTK